MAEQAGARGPEAPGCPLGCARGLPSPGSRHRNLSPEAPGLWRWGKAGARPAERAGAPGRERWSGTAAVTLSPEPATRHTAPSEGGLVPATGRSIEQERG